MDNVYLDSSLGTPRYFQFGWTGTPELANSIAMERLPLPSLLVVNASTLHHHMPEDPAKHLTPEAIHLFLDAVLAQNAPVSLMVAEDVLHYSSFLQKAVLSS